MSFSSQTPAPEGYTKRSNARDVNVDLSLFPPFVKQLDVKYPEYEREGDIEYPFEETNGAGDENRIRGNWSSRADFILSAVGFTVGIGNLWRFPVLVFENGGAAFLVPYLIMLILAALPMLFLEATLGQFASLAAISVWKVVPLFKGVGIAMVLISCVLAIYLNIVSAWSLFYLINSVSFSLPWSNCENSWSGLNCTLGTRITCTAMNGTLLVNGSCIVQTANSTVQVMRLYDEHTIPSLKYFHNDVLMLSPTFDDIGTLNWYLGICVVISWIIVFLCLFQGVKSSGKVVYVIVIVPVIILAVLFARLFTLDGSPSAVLHFLKPDWNILSDLHVWGEAAVHAFYSVSCCTGGIITLTSYNRFHNRLFGDIAAIMVIDFAASIVCCLLTFSAIGFTCYEFSIDLDKFHIGNSVHLVFVFLAEALAGVPVAPLYTGLFFLFLFFIILSTQIIVVETIVTSLCDEFAERLRKNRRHVLTTVVGSFILLSLPFCLSAGFYWLLLLSKFTITWPLVVIAFLECMAVSWVSVFMTGRIYGVDNLLDNIKWVTGSYPPCYLFWKILWKFVCPMVYLCILCFLWMDWTSVIYEDYHFPYWTILLGWGISIFPLLFVPITAIVQLCLAKGNLTQKWHKVLNPDDAWGPALAVHRAEHFPLQIPEARRLLLPPEVEIASSAPMINEDDDGAPSESAIDQRSNRAVAPSRSAGAPTITSLPQFERETAI